MTVHRTALAVASVLILLLGRSTAPAADLAAEENRPPNIVLIVSDDQGYRDLGSFGSEVIQTPHLDRLAKEGVRCTNFYVTWPACTPSRGSLLTGRYPQRNGLYDMIRNDLADTGHLYGKHEYAVSPERILGMDTREVLFAQILKKKGYATGVFGKWDGGQLKRFLPLQRGFDEFYGFTNTGVDYFTHERYGVPSMYRNNSPTVEDKGTYCTDLFEREALRFIDKHKDRPFLLYLPFNAPHGGSNLDPKIRGLVQAPEEYKKKYAHLKLKDELVKGRRYGKPAMVPGRDKRKLEYLACVTCMDAAIGSVLNRLDEHQLADNTLVVFFSDNGGSGAADNSPLRGRKAQMWEGGIRVPFVARFPGRIPAGTKSDEFLTSLEMFPTLLKVAGAEPPEDVVLDGFDCLPVLAGKAKSQREEMFWERRGDKAARVGRYKWVSTPRGGGLFDLQTDVGEKRDLSEERPDLLKKVKSRFQNWKREMQQSDPRGPFRDF